MKKQIEKIMEAHKLMVSALIECIEMPKIKSDNILLDSKTPIEFGIGVECKNLTVKDGLVKFNDKVELTTANFIAKDKKDRKIRVNRKKNNVNKKRK